MPQRFSKLEVQEKGIALLHIPGSPKASSRQLLEALRHHAATISDSRDIRGVIVTSGAGSFCSCSEDPLESPQAAHDLASFGQEVLFRLEKTGKPCIAAIGGECSGIGLELALACDFIIAGSSARFGFPDIISGRLPFCGGTQRLARLVGKSRAKELVFGGDLIGSETALAIGLVNRLYADDELLPRTRELLEKICTRSPFAIRIGGEIINAGYDIDLQTACLMERDAFGLIFASKDQREGMQAFLEKRTPDFAGE